MSSHKIDQLTAMLKWEQSHPESEQYGAHLTHWAGTSKAINLEAGALMALITYYQSRAEINRIEVQPSKGGANDGVSD